MDEHLCPSSTAHETTHAVVSRLMLDAVCASLGIDPIEEAAKAKVYLELPRHNRAGGELRVAWESKSVMERQHEIAAGAALAPVFVHKDSDHLVEQAFDTGSVAPLLKSTEPSPTDFDNFHRHPLDAPTVLMAGLVVRHFMQGLDTNKLAGLLSKAVLLSDNMLTLPLLVNEKRYAKAKAAALKQYDSLTPQGKAKAEEARLKLRHTTKQEAFDKSTGKEREIREHMRRNGRG